MGRLGQCGVVVAAALAMSGCWPAPGQGPDRQAHNAVEEGFDATTVSGFTELWTATTDETGPRGVSHPILSEGGGVHVTSTHSVYAFDAATGALRWVETPDPTLYDQVDTEVFSDDRTDSLYVSLRRNEHNWEPGQFDVATGSWFTGETNGRMEAVRTDASGLPMPLLSEFAPTPSGGTSQRGFLFTRPGSAVLTESPDLSSRLTLGRDRFFHAGVGVGTAPRNGVRSYPNAGGAGWATPIGGHRATTPVLSSDGTTVYVGADNGTMYALDATTGALRWESPVEFPVTAPAALAEGVLYVPTLGGLVALSADDGTWLWNTPGTTGIPVQPAVAAGVVFVGSDDGVVWAFDADGCGGESCPTTTAALWSADLGSPVTGAPAVSLGRLFVGTQDGRLVAFGPPSP